MIRELSYVRCVASGARCASGVLLAVITTVIDAQPAPIESVIVWAEKRSAPSQEVPIAMSIMSSDALSSAGVSDVEALARRLASLDLQYNAGLTTTSLRIRRVGNIGNIPTFEPAIGLFVDGAYRSRSFLGTSSLVSVDRVEVLRGPQTTLYGKNVSGGLVAVYTREPPQTFDLRAELSRGSIDAPDVAALRTYQFDVGGSIRPALRGSFAARLTEHDPTLVNVLPDGPPGNDRHLVTARGQLAWSARDTLDLRLLAGYLREDDDQGESEVYLEPGAASTRVSGVLQGLGLTPGCGDNIPRNRVLCSVATNEVSAEAVDLTLLAELRLENGWNFRSTTSWDRYDILRLEDDAIQLFAPMLFYHDAERGRSLQQEVLLQFSDERLSWLVGGFYYDNEYRRGDGGATPMFGANGDLGYDPIWETFLGGVPLALPEQLGIHDSRLGTRYLSVFGQLSAKLTSHLRLTGGLRWQTEEKQASINNSTTVPGASLISVVLTPSATLSGEPVNGNLGRTSDTTPWSFTGQYFFGDDIMAYLTTARGSKSGSFNTGFGDAPLSGREFGDEKIRHYEIGMKMQLADQRLTLQSAAFYTRYDGYQDSAFISAQFSVANAERVDLNGVELDASMRWVDRLTTVFSVSFADLEYATNTHGLCYPGRIPDGSRPGSCILSGEHPIHAPEIEASFMFQYERPTNWGAIVLGFDWAWSDDYNTSFSADPRLVLDAYSDVSTRLAFRLKHSHEVVLWGENLLDETITHFDSLLNLFNDASYQSYFAPPRSYGVTWRYRH